MEKLLSDKNFEINNINILTLAFLGDAVFDLIVRQHIILNNDYNLKDINRAKVQMVCCKSQASLVDKIICNFYDDELNIYKRGRNSKVKNIPDGASREEYHKATGLEAVVGYLYLKGKIDRITELLKMN